MQQATQGFGLTRFYQEGQSPLGLVEGTIDGIFYERVVNRILDDLVAAAKPRSMKIVGDFNVRGGLKSIISEMSLPSTMGCIVRTAGLQIGRAHV